MEKVWDDFNHWTEFLEAKDLSEASLREYKRDVRQFLEWLKGSGGGYSSAKNIGMCWQQSKTAEI
ncbi:site-specific integrase [Fluviispira sanaruensis]|uniref:Core-binding (CB) domain-containing protein n=1 Tax=Fluviispira sanaruensis TaxID=2493639 RepID=A0A4P2VQJ5_FLUSA|nr:site-specific integrase [Fluviispira sanaruensis]BBH54680.1 hypothetical protein JCM31447_31540 [Fluviispira sanaruensis]